MINHYQIKKDLKKNWRIFTAPRFRKGKLFFVGLVARRFGQMRFGTTRAPSVLNDKDNRDIFMSKTKEER